MDREDSYPDQSRSMSNHHRGTMAGSHWEDLCSSASICSQSSDEEMKPIGHSKGELYPHAGDTRDYPSAVVNLLPHSGPSAGLGPPVDLGGPPYSGKIHLKHFWRHKKTQKLHKCKFFYSILICFFWFECSTDR